MLLFLFNIVSMIAVKLHKKIPFPSSFVSFSAALIPSPKDLEFFIEHWTLSVNIFDSWWLLPCDPLDESDISSRPILILWFFIVQQQLWKHLSREESYFRPGVGNGGICKILHKWQGVPRKCLWWRSAEKKLVYS